MTDPSEPADPAESRRVSKLDPILQERLDTRGATVPDEATTDEGSAGGASGNAPDTPPVTAQQIEVMVALIAPPTSEDIDAMSERGLTVRSAIGDILTGVVALNQVEHLSSYEAILKIESSTPLQIEDPDASRDEVFDVSDLIE